MDELIRLTASVVIAATLIGVCTAIGRARTRRRASPALELVERLGLPPGQPAVIYLSAAQGQAIPPGAPDGQSSVRTHVIVHRLLADTEPELLRQLQIASLPATIVIGRDHAVQAVHTGVTDVEGLAEQLA